MTRAIGTSRAIVTSGATGMSRAIVIGGGVAGLAAAVALTERGAAVTLFEARPHTGGRAFSFHDRATDVDIDNGQHLVMGCCTATLSLLRTIGSDGLLARVDPMRIPFLHADGRRAELRPGALPHPLNLVQGFLGYRMLGVVERLAVLRVAASLRLASARTIDALDGVAAANWLAAHGQRAAALDLLWRPIVLATMNADVHEVSAKLFAVVLREIFLGRADGSALLLATRPLSDIFAHPALDWLRARGAEVHLHRAVERVLVTDGCAAGVVDAGGILHAADLVVSTVPHDACRALMRRSGLEGVVGGSERLHAAPIVSVHVWSTTRITAEAMTGLLGTRVQWVFDKGSVGDLHHVSCTISAATGEEYEDPVQVESFVRKELCRVYPHLRGEDIVRVKVIRERRATFLPAPGLEGVRPATQTSVPGLLLAGDWTATGLPATIEGAVRSGFVAGTVGGRLRPPCTH